MPPELRRRFEAFLLSLPEWEREESRRVLLNCLRPYRLWQHLHLSGAPAQVAERLFTLEGRFGCEPFEALLAELRERNSIHEARAKEIDQMREDLRRLARRPKQGWDREPYLGLTYFDRGDAPIFFGRDEEVAELAEAVRGSEAGGQFLVVAGDSGAGKSSLVRAGLWAGLEEGRIKQIPGGREWLIAAMIPGQLGRPIASLRAGLDESLRRSGKFRSKAGLASRVEQGSLRLLAEQLLEGSPAEARWLLILDQMEELFSAEMWAEGAGFLDRLIEATQADDDGRPSRFVVIATLRSDFLGNCAQHPPLMRVLNRAGGLFMLGAPKRVALERMVSGPIEELDLGELWWLDPALPGMLADEVYKHSGGLSLMAFALQELYRECRPKLRLDTATFAGEDFGGLSGAISRRAEATLGELGDGAAEALSRVFQRLVRVSPGGEAATRRREHLSAWANYERAQELIEALVKARLLVATTGPSSEALSEAVVEVAHEALLREWPRLAQWIALRREAFVLAERVRTEAKAWMAGDPARHSRRHWHQDVIEEARGILAEAGLLDHLLEDAAVRRLLAPEAEWLVMELERAETPTIRRAEIGARLAELGDPRPGVGVANGIPQILWCAIPGGAVDIEGHGSFPVEPFEMAKYPVTVAQFLAFLDAEDGFGFERWWQGLENGSVQAEWRGLQGNESITKVNWYDAVAFCRWLTVKLHEENLRYDVRLPAEWEWQWAAQSAEVGFRYPWGEDWKEGVANTRESKIGRVAAVGLFQEGDSLLQKVSDLSGNVWEWCLNEYEDPQSSAAAGSGSRALRGGSWFGLADFALAGLRSNSLPVNRYNDFGFRLVRSSPIC